MNPTLVFAIALLTCYVALVQRLRFRRRDRIGSMFANKCLPEMTTQQSFDIIDQLQHLEFPYAFNKAREIALLKAGGIPTMSKLFAVTGQNTRKNASKRAVDTEILLLEAQTQQRDSERYMCAVARMNYLHSRYRQAGKILDEDLLHTLGDGLAEIFRVVDGQEWRCLTEVEKCALGIFHLNLGKGMQIPFDPLPSSKDGWRDGRHFAQELVEWTNEYEERVCHFTEQSDAYVRVYVDSATAKMPRGVTRFLRKTLGFELDEPMRRSLGIEAPGTLLKSVLTAIRFGRKFILRHLALPRRSSHATRRLQDEPDPNTGLYHFSHFMLKPWYIQPAFGTSYGPRGMLIRLLGGYAPGPERFKPEGYSLQSIGPQPQEEKGLEHMHDTIRALREAGSVSQCPFSSLKSKQG